MTELHAHNLWVYGCSFSEPFGIDPGAIFDNNGYRKLSADFWGTHLAKKLGMKCVTRSLSGVGWNYINDRIDEDIMSWDKEDIIIISPSFFSRCTIEEFTNRVCQTELLLHFRSFNEVSSHNESRWAKKIQTLQYLGYKVYTWVLDDTVYKLSNIIEPDGLSNWKKWMDLHKAFWQDPTTNKYPLGDWHFNERGHEAVAEIMFDYIAK